MDVPLYKLGYLDGEVVKEFNYRNTFRTERTSEVTRLRIAPMQDHLSLLWKLSSTLGIVYLLYVLHTSRCDDQMLGRYRRPPLDWQGLNTFLAEFGEFLSYDGRHDLWLHSDQPDTTLVWDRHNVIYAYGPLERFIEVLKDQDFTEGEEETPYPHVHMYHREFDESERKIVEYFNWQREALRPNERQGPLV